MKLRLERWSPLLRHLLRWMVRWGLRGVAATTVLSLLALLLLFRWYDQVLAGLYGRWRPKLEQQIGQVLGHPLSLGPYRGIGFDGVLIGPSRLGPGRQDGSTASVEGARVMVHPLASWRQRTWILDLSFQGAQADLRRNGQGQFWVLGPIQAGQKPPRLDLTFRLLEPGRVRLHGIGNRLGNGLGAADRILPLEALGQVGLRIHRHEVDWRTVVRLPGASGSALVNGGGQWQQRRWTSKVESRGLALAPLWPLLPIRGGPAGGPPGLLSGQADGRLDLSLVRGQPACRGSLQLRQVRWRPSAGAGALVSELLPLQCRERQLELASSAWSYGSWRGAVAATAGLDRRLGLNLRIRPPASNPLGATPILTSLVGSWQNGGLRISTLEARRGASRLQARGTFGRQLDLQGNWMLERSDLPGAARLPDWLFSSPLRGSLALDGSLGRPRLRLATGQPAQVLVGPWQASLEWSANQLRLQQFRSAHLQASGTLPLAIRFGKGLERGDLDAQLELSAYPLAKLNPLLGSNLRGSLEAGGRVQGPLTALRPDLVFRVQHPGVGPLQLQERWQGHLQASAWDAPRSQPGGGTLQLRSLEAGHPGLLTAELDRRWLPARMRLERSGGWLELQGQPSRYRWSAQAFPLRGLAVAAGQPPRFRTLQGQLSGAGQLGLQPLGFQGNVALAEPLFLGVGARRLQADVRYREREFRVRGLAETIAGGTIETALDGRWQGPFRASFRARGLTTLVLRQVTQALGVWRGAPVARAGQASDLGSFAIEGLGRSLQDQFAALQQAQAAVLGRDQELRQASRTERLERLQARVDADLVLSGPDLQSVNADLKASGHVWEGLADRDRVLASDPFQVRLEGPIRQGSGQFSLSGLSLGLLALLAPVPESLRGSLAVKGRYRLGGRRPELALTLALDDSYFGQRRLVLNRGAVELRDSALQLDLALQSGNALNSLDLSGTLPLQPRSRDLELRLASRGDGLRFLTELSGKSLEWRRGSADLQLLVRGSLAEPIANGFLRIRDGECQFIGQQIRGLQATALFDFNQLVVQDLRARVGAKGRISGEGRLGLWRRRSDQQSLAVELRQVPFSLSRITAVSDGRLTFGGSLLAPELGGDLTIRQGTINAQPGQLAKADGNGPATGSKVEPVSFNELLERKWDFRQPLVLLGPEQDSSTRASLERAIPRVPWLSFDQLKLSFGPDLRVVVPRVANFVTGGSLRISGRLDPSLRASGVVRLLGGRLNLFTTSFSLDPSAPNVAVFTPSLGLVPYLDIALRTRISDSLNVISPGGFTAAGLGSSSAPSLVDLSNQSGFSSLNQLKLILVTVSVSGPADRIAETIKLRSSPPMPQERLVALIGGNSLAGLRGGEAGTALATVLGQSLLSPLLSSLSDALGQRVSLALYPTYVNQAISTQQELRSRRVPPQLVLGSEIGLDITDRFNASVLAAPNRSDVPPQVTLKYRASESLNLEGSIDTQGAWQTQLQVFFRF